MTSSPERSPDALHPAPSQNGLLPAAEGELWDSIIVGAGVAGLSAALALGRSLRRVLVLDLGAPRNRFAEHMHTVLGNEGTPPSEFLDRGRSEAARYGVLFHSAGVAAVRESTAESGPRSLVVTLTDGRQLAARTVIAASGVTDQLPEIPGLAERWGKTVLHCPYCHGWEVRHQRLGVLATGPMALHQAELLRQWSSDLTFFSAAAGPLDPGTVARLESRGVVVETVPVSAVHGEGPAVTAVVLQDGRSVPVDALFTAGRLVPHDDYLTPLELERAETPVGSFIQSDQTGRTSHDRVWAAGNLTAPMANVPSSMSQGTMAGGMANMTLVTEDFDLAAQQHTGSEGRL